MALLDIFTGRGREAEAPADQPARPNIPAMPVRQLIDHARRDALLKMEAHVRGTQHAHKIYDWEANIKTGSHTFVPMDAYIPMRERRPCVSLRLGKVITKRLTTMVFGHDRFPTITIRGDDDAQDYVRELARVARLRTKLVEARNKGGAAGSVVLSWGFDEGRPVVDVHSAGLVEVLEWADYEARKPRRVLKIYDFQESVIEDKQMKRKTFWYVRYWDESIEVTWRRIPDDVAKTEAWATWPVDRVDVQHDLGACPVIWVQNICDSESVDGHSDFDGQEEDFDELDRLASAIGRGIIQNVDPTLVVNDKKRKDEGVVHKGSGHVLYSEGGANYLELSGGGFEAGRQFLREMRQAELDEAEVVVLDPEQVSGMAVSGESLKTRYMAMLAKCDLLRDQYGEAMTTVLRAMLETARTLRAPVEAEDGSRSWSRVELEPRLDIERPEGDGDPVVTETERTPGTSSRIELKWPPYFPATWQDRKTAVETAKAATGRQVLSTKTATEALQTMFDIEDADDETDRIEEDQEKGAERARAMMEAGAPAVNLQGRQPNEGRVAGER